MNGFALRLVFIQRRNVTLGCGLLLLYLSRLAKFYSKMIKLGETFHTFISLIIDEIRILGDSTPSVG